MASLDDCIQELTQIIVALQNRGPMLRMGVVDAVTATAVTVSGVDMAFLDVGVTPVVTRSGAYLRQGASTVFIGMLAE